MAISTESALYRFARLTRMESEPIDSPAELAAETMMSVLFIVACVGILYCVTAIMVLTFLPIDLALSLSKMEMLFYQVLTVLWSLAGWRAFIFVLDRLAR